MSRKETCILISGFLLAAVVILTLAHLVSPVYSERNYELFNEMMHSPAYKTQSENPNFADGITQRVPPENTIARGFMPLDLAPGTDGQRLAAKLINPVSDTDAAARKRGAAIYRQICMPCHGVMGNGDGPVALKGFPPPPSLLADHSQQLTDGAIFHIITLGQVNMPALASQVDVADRWNVIRHIRNLQNMSPTRQGRAPTRQGRAPGQGASK